MQRPQIRQLLEPLLELRVPDLRAPKHDGRDGDVDAAHPGHAVHRDVERAERGQRRAEAVARAHDAEDLVLVLGHQLAHRGEQLLPRAVLGEGRPLIAGDVDEVPPLHHASLTPG